MHSRVSISIYGLSSALERNTGLFEEYQTGFIRAGPLWHLRKLNTVKFFIGRGSSLLEHKPIHKKYRVETATLSAVTHFPTPAVQKCLEKNLNGIEHSLFLTWVQLHSALVIKAILVPA